jgi:hypothetical protein
VTGAQREMLNAKPFTTAQECSNRSVPVSIEHFALSILHLLLFLLLFPAQTG